MNLHNSCKMMRVSLEMYDNRATRNIHTFALLIIISVISICDNLALDERSTNINEHFPFAMYAFHPMRIPLSITLSLTKATSYSGKNVLLVSD